MAGAITGLVGGGTIGGAVVRLVLDSSEFNAGLTAAEGRLKGAGATMQRLGTGMSRVGSTLTRGVTVPLVAAGAVATKMALDFNKAFVQIQTLAAKGGHSIAEMKTEVLSLAQATGQDPNGLATALYQVLSAGKAAASQAFPILTAAAKGAAIGMGSVTDISKVLTSTMNAYGPKVISASQAMDILTQATKDSAAEADALSTSLGPVIGVAAQAGISFKEVAAAMATATNAGISTERAATGLRFLIGSLSTPTTAAKDALDRYGVSVQALQRMLASQGLVGTLQSLAKTFDLTSTRGAAAFKALVGGQRGFVAAASLVGKTSDQASAEVKKLGDVVGVTNQRFTIWGQTITGKNAIALGKLKVAAIQLGQKLIPIFEHAVTAVTHLVDAFTNLSPQAQEAWVKMGLIAALAGPFLKLGGIVAGLTSKFISMASAAGKAAGAGGAAASGGGGATAAATQVGAGAGSVFGTAFLAAGSAAIQQGAPILIKKEYTSLTGSSGIGNFISGIAKQAIDAATGIHFPDLFGNIPKNPPPVLMQTIAQAKQMGAAFSDVQVQAIQAAIDNEQFAKATSLLRDGIAKATSALRGQGVASMQDLHSLESYRSGLLGTSKAAQNMGKWINIDNGLTQTQKTHLASVIGSIYKYGGSLNQAQQAAFDAAVAAGDYTSAVNILKGAIDKLPKSKQVKITADTGQAQNAITTIQQKVDSLHGKIIPITVTYTTSGRPPVGGPAGSVNRVAGGGVIHGASGFVTRGPTYQMGEGNYSTFAGRGAEAVTPLDSRGIGILAKALKMAGGGGAGRGINLTINTQGNFNEETLAASVSRHLARTIREEALV